MSHLKAGNRATVVDQDAVGGRNEPNILRHWPVKGVATQIGKVGVGSAVQLLHGPFTDQAGGRWWAVQVLTDNPVLNDPNDPNLVGYQGWMAEYDPARPNVVNLI